jgi:hypothetical protein
MTYKKEINLLELFSLKLLLAKTTNSLLEAQIAGQSVNYNLFSKHTASPWYDYIGQQNLRKKYVFILNHLTKLLFYKNVKLSRFSARKTRVVDRRYNPPKLAEFGFNLEEVNPFLTGLYRAKVPVNTFINTINYRMHLYPFFYKNFSLRRIEPYEQLIPIILRKAFLKRYTFNFLSSSKKNANSLFMSLSLLTLAISKKTFFKRHIFVPPCNVLTNFIVFFKETALRGLNQATGLVVFKKLGGDLLSLKKKHLVQKNEINLVRHYGHYYPFSKKEIQFARAPGFITPKHAGKRTLFFFITKKMLNFRKKNYNLALATTQFRIFPKILHKSLLHFYSDYSNASKNLNLQLN